MGIVVEGESEMADVMGGVFGFHHGSEGDHLDELLFLGALALMDELVHTAGSGALGAGGLELVAELTNEGAEFLHLLGVGVVVDSIGKGLGFLALGYLTNGLGNGAVGEEHELLDEFVGVLGTLEIATGGLALLVDVELHLLGVEIDGAALEAFLTKLLGKGIEGAELLGVFALIGVRGER